MKPRFPLACLALGAAAALGACSDPERLRARFEVAEDTLAAFALTGTPPQYPSALVTAANVQRTDGKPGGGPLVARLDGAVPFDIAFDVNADGAAVLYPVKLVASNFGSAARVGLQRSASTYDSLLRAPASGYEYDSALVVRPGELVVIEAQSAYCSGALQPLIYSKLVVDSIATSDRIVHFRIAVDPNCGFRSFVPGVVPTN